MSALGLRATFGRSRVFVEIVAVEPLECVGLHLCDADAVLDHQLSELRTADQDDALLNSTDVVECSGPHREAGRRSLPGGSIQQHVKA